MMSSFRSYRVPDVIDIIYHDIVGGLYFKDGNRSVRERILNIKCNLACDLLLHSDFSEVIISEKIKFEDCNRFRFEFEKRLGILPLEFRKRFG